jgi:hypothetical protein
MNFCAPDPRLAASNAPYCGRPNPISLCDGSLRLTFQQGEADFGSLLQGKFRSRMLKPSEGPMSPFRHHVVGVIGNRPVKEVGGVTTGRAVAGVAGVLWPIAMCQEEGNAIRLVRVARLADLPITLYVARRTPWPTRLWPAGHVNLRPESISKGTSPSNNAASPGAESGEFSALNPNDRRATNFTGKLVGHSGSSNESVCEGLGRNPSPSIVPKTPQLSQIQGAI